MTQVLNFVGGPGAGKSTLAHEVFSVLKKQGLDVAWAGEFATDLVWREQIKSLNDQLYLLGEQHHLIYQMLGKVQYIVTDTSLIMQLYYLDDAFKKYKAKDYIPDVPYEDFHWAMVNVIDKAFHMVDNKVFFVDRGDRVIDASRYGLGRVHDHERSIRIDAGILKILDDNFIPYHTVTTTEEVLKTL